MLKLTCGCVGKYVIVPIYNLQSRDLIQYFSTCNHAVGVIFNWQCKKIVGVYGQEGSLFCNALDYTYDVQKLKDLDHNMYPIKENTHMIIENSHPNIMIDEKCDIPIEDFTNVVKYHIKDVYPVIYDTLTTYNVFKLAFANIVQEFPHLNVFINNTIITRMRNDLKYIMRKYDNFDIEIADLNRKTMDLNYGEDIELMSAFDWLKQRLM